MADNAARKIYKLYYFDAFGLAEPIRYLLNYCGIDYEDIRIDLEDEWYQTYKAEMPTGQVPVLEIDGVKYHQHLAICRYIARMNNLCGSNDEEACLMDALVADINYIRLEIDNWFHEENPPLRTTMKMKLLKNIEFFLGRFETRVKENNGFFVGSKISWVDIYYAATVDSISKYMMKDVNVKYPHLNDLTSSIRNHSMIAPYIWKRPVTEF